MCIRMCIFQLFIITAVSLYIPSSMGPLAGPKPSIYEMKDWWKILYERLHLKVRFKVHFHKKPLLSELNAVTGSWLMVQTNCALWRQISVEVRIFMAGEKSLN